MIADFRSLVESLVEHEVECAIISGIALVLRGSARTTQDLDICYGRAPENLQRLVDALSPFHPTLRGAPRELPFKFDTRSLASGLNFTFASDAGDVDILGEVPGIGDYSAVISTSTRMEIYGLSIAVLSLDGLERAKRAAGRLKDVLDLAEIAELKKLEARSA